MEKKHRIGIEERLARRLGHVRDEDIETARKFAFLNVESAEDFESLVDFIEELQRRRSGVAGTSGEAKRKPLASRGVWPMRPRLLQREQDRWEARTAWESQAAGAHSRVQDFRTRALRQGVLDADTARALLKSPAAARFPATRCATALVHDVVAAEVVGEHEAPDRYAASVTVGQETWAYDCDLRDRAPGGNQFANGSVNASIATPDGSIDVLYWPNSFIDELLSVGYQLNRLSLSFVERSAAWFVLTGVFHAKSPFRTYSTTIVTGRPRTILDTIVFEVEPWISVDTVKRTWQKWHVGHDPSGGRQPSERRIALFRFVTEASDTNARRPPWRTVMAEWNDVHPEWLYSNARNFARDYWAAAAILLPGRVQQIRGHDGEEG